MVDSRLEAAPTVGAASSRESLKWHHVDADRSLWDSSGCDAVLMDDPCHGGIYEIV